MDGVVVFLFVALLTCGAVALGCALAARVSPVGGGVVVDAEGVRRLRPAETVRWADLVHVGILTTADGPAREDVYFLLLGHDGKGCVVPQGDAVAVGLLDWLQRLPGFDNHAVVLAMGSCEEASFPCWSGAPGDARVVASGPLTGGSGHDGEEPSLRAPDAASSSM
jgi:hypothetical protein